MELAAVVDALGIAEAAEALAPEWDAAQATLPAGPLPFLAPGFVAAASAAAALPAEVAALALVTAEHAAASAPLRALAWHGHHCLYRAAAYPRSFGAWPALTAALGRPDHLFYLLVLLSGMPELQRRYQQHDVPETVAADTLFDIERWLRVHRERHGDWGLAPDRLNWLRHHMRGELYQLGRLQFQFGVFAPGFLVFRQRRTGRVLALAEGGLRFRADGQLDGAGGVVDPEGAWTSRLELGEREVRGSPILPEGAARREEVALARAEWEPALAPGDPVLHLHIPAGSPLDFDACGRSLHQAPAFFPRHFPERPFVAFACSSWLLDAQLEGMLPPSSNLVRFLREMYLLPARSGGAGTLERVFGSAAIDPARAPRDTALRRAIADHLLAGGHLRGARCFLFPRDLRWGEQVYRRQAGGAAAASAAQRGDPARP